MSKLSVLSSFRSFQCPPEYTLRLAVRARNIETKQTEATTASNQSNTYKVAVCNELGKPLSVENRTRLPLASNQVRVSVDYAAVNFGDILQVAGKYQVKPSLPFIPGSELCGRVIETGTDVPDVKPGDSIVAFVTPDANSGGYSEEVIVEHGIYRINQDLPKADGAAIGVSYGTAYMALVRHARIKAGDIVLVSAAAGALGLATVDLAANVFGAKVIGLCGGAEKSKLVKSYGAFETIDYNCEDVKSKLKQLTNGEGVDIMVDMVGGKLFEDCVRSMAFDGRLLTLGYASGKIPNIPANLLLVKNISVHGVYFGSHSFRRPEVFDETVNAVLQLGTEKKIRPHIGKIFSLHQVNEALQFVADRQSTGKVLLDCRRSQ